MSTKSQPPPPSPNGRNGGRDARGRFTKGNPGGPGNPFARRVSELRSALLGAVEPTDLADVIQGLVVAAKEGDVAAAKLVLSYLVGQPASDFDVAREDRARKQHHEDDRRQALADLLLSDAPDREELILAALHEEMRRELADDLAFTSKRQELLRRALPRRRDPDA